MVLPADGAAAQTVGPRLAFGRPLWPGNLFGHLAATAVPGVEEWRDGWYRRTLRLPHGAGVVALAPRADHIACRLTLADPRDRSTAVRRCRRMLDLDADPIAIDTHLGRDPDLAALVRNAPGRRVPGTVDPAEFAVRAVLGQQVSTAAARTHAARLVAAHGEQIDDPGGGLTHLFPNPAALQRLDPASLALPAARLPGFGPWTIEMIAFTRERAPARPGRRRCSGLPPSCCCPAPRRGPRRGQRAQG